MFRLMRLSPRRALIIIHDLIATLVAILATFYVRFEDAGFIARLPGLLPLLPGILLYAAMVYWYFDLYRSKWRFASLPDLSNIFRAASVLAVSILALDYVLLSPNFYGTFFFGKITIALYWFLQIAFLAGPRILYRYFRYARTQQQVRGPEALPALVLGLTADAEVLLRSIESGAVKKIRPVGILSPSPADQNQALRGIPVLGTPDDLEAVINTLERSGTRVVRLIMTPSVLAADQHPEAILMRARQHGINVSRMPSLSDGDAIELAPIDVEDLLLRPTTTIDYGRLESLVRGKSVLVTGGGGSIGAEICDRVITFGAARLLVIENSEPALHAVIERLVAKDKTAKIEGRIADVRDRERIFSLIGDYKPELVFHAAALKHVPLLEKDWTEGIKTNILGSINVADATVAAGADAMVMISTDKAIDPVSVLGITKRFAEMYCQALDADLASRPHSGRQPVRIVAVRFGNVLASNGSVVPKFKAQIEAGGPVTVTHPDMVRYFMTIREACDLVLTAASHALGAQRSEVSIYVLNMGQPVKIVDLAERMIRLVGLEPGRDIEIVFSGIRPGERLNEILFGAEEPSAEIGIPGIVAARPIQLPLDTLRAKLEVLAQAVADGDRDAVFKVLQWPKHSSTQSNLGPDSSKSAMSATAVSGTR
jgi:O-antigen biosynthesis protein WbqV